MDPHSHSQLSHDLEEHHKNLVTPSQTLADNVALSSNFVEKSDLIEDETHETLMGTSEHSMTHLVSHDDLSKEVEVEGTETQLLATGTTDEISELASLSKRKRSPEHKDSSADSLCAISGCQNKRLPQRRLCGRHKRQRSLQRTKEALQPNPNRKPYAEIRNKSEYLSNVRLKLTQMLGGEANAVSILGDLITKTKWGKTNFHLEDFSRFEKKICQDLSEMVKNLPRGNQVKQFIIGNIGKDFPAHEIGEFFEVSEQKVIKDRNGSYEWITSVNYPKGVKRGSSPPHPSFHEFIDDGEA